MGGPVEHQGYFFFFQAIDTDSPTGHLKTTEIA